MWERLGPRLRRNLSVALEQAGRLGNESAGARELLLAIAADTGCAGYFVLEQSGVSPARVIEDLQRTPVGEPRQRAHKLDTSALQLLEAASEESRRLGQSRIGTEHVIIALARLPHLDAGKALGDLEMTAANAEAAARRWAASRTERGRGPHDDVKARSPVLTAILRPMRKIARAPTVVWKIYARKSLGHPRFVVDPYPLYRWIREREPVRKDPLAPVWVLTRYEDVLIALRDPRFKKDPFAGERFPKTFRQQLGAPEIGGRGEIEIISMLFLDPPEHTRVRGAFARAFTPRNLADLRPRIERITTEQLNRVAAAGRMDIIADLAYPLPVIVIAELLGFPPEDYPKIKRWSDDFAASLGLNASAEAHARANQSRDEIREYFDGIVMSLKERPADTLLNRLLESRDQPAGLNVEEIFSNAVLLLAAGHETTTNLIGNGMVTMMRHRDQWELLAREPGLVESAVDEMLRFDSPVQWISRLTGEPIELGGKRIDSNEIVLGSLGAANRDPEKFEDPDRFDIRRKDNKYLSFGTGIHYCLGAALAKMEAQIVLAALARRFPAMRANTRKLKWMKGLTFRGVTSLPVTWEG